MAGKVRHPADERGIEKASVSGLGMIRLELKGGESSWTVVSGRAGGKGTSQPQGGDDDGSGHKPQLTLHEHPALSRSKLSRATRVAGLIMARSRATSSRELNGMVT